MDEPLAFGEFLRRCRLAAGLTQEALAERAGVSARTVSDLERGINLTPRRDTLQLLADALALSPGLRADLERTAHRPPRPASPDGQALGIAVDASSPGQEDTAELRIRLLGGFRVQIGSRTVPDEAWRLRNSRRLLLVLALAPRHRLPREQVADLLWPDSDAHAAANNLHQILHVTRHILEPDAQTPARYLRLQDGMLDLSPQRQPLVDVDAFEVAATVARQAVDTERYEMALALYAGDLAPEERYDDWVAGRREALRQEYLRLLRDLARLHAGRRDHAEAINVLRRLLAADPCDEESHIALMRLYAEAGARRDALQQYGVLEATLLRELDTTPREESRRLYQQILAWRFPFTPGPAPLDSPLVAASGARAYAGGNPARRLHNLPVQLNRFVGRANDREEITRLLAASRLLTLTGTGGCGKTRLALEVAADLLDRYPDGVWLVELAALGQPGLAPQAVAAALGVVEQQGQPLPQTLAGYLAEKRLLLVLDNCEHLIAASAALAETLVRACPHLRILCTSREALRVGGEVTWQVRSLALPDPHRLPAVEDAAQYEAIDLFCERAQAVSPAFRLTRDILPAVAQICYRLDGLPLAIELAAARVAVLTVGQIVARLDDCFKLLTGGSRTALTRQQTLKATLDWSHDLLSASEQALFRRLAVFQGGFTLEAVEAISVGTPDTPGILDLLVGLVEKSLVLADEQAVEARYRLLEPVRQYARQAAAHSGELGDMYRWRRDWALALAEQADSRFWTVEQDASLAILEAEHDNLRAAMDWCVRTSGEGDAGLRLARALWQFWLWRGHFTEGQGWFERVLAAAPAPTALRAEVLLRAGTLIARRGDIRSGMIWIEQARDVYAALGDQRGLLHALHIQGVIVWVRFDFARAQVLLEKGLQLAQASGSTVDSALITHSLGAVAWGQGDFGRAQARMERSLERLRAVGDEPRVAISFINLGIATRAGTGIGVLGQMQEETLVLFREMGTRTLIGYMLANLGNLARAMGEIPRAERLLEESLAVFRALQDRAGLAQVSCQLAHLAITMGHYGRAQGLLEESLALRTATGDRRGIIRSLAGLGHLAQAEGDLARACAFTEESMRRAQEIGDIASMPWLHIDLGYLAALAGDYDQAVFEYQQVAERSEQIGHSKYGLALSRSRLGLVALLQGKRRQALAYLEQSVELCRDFGDRRSSAALLRLMGELEQEMGDSHLAEAHFAESATLYLRIGEEHDVATGHPQ